MNERAPGSDPGTMLDGFKGVDVTQPIVSVTATIFAFAFIVWLWWSFRGSSATGGQGNGGLNYVVGPMGSGKSMFGVRRIVAAVASGTYVVTNVRLLPGWEEKVRRKLFPRDRGRDRARRREQWLAGFYIYEPSLEEAMRYRLPCVSCGGSPRECEHPQRGGEARAIFVWDETHNDLNNRDYMGHGDTRDARERERERRRLVLRWATQLRKLGFVGFLLSQHQENTDAQLRRVCNHVIRLQNQRHRGLGQLLPARLSMFLVYWYPSHLADGTNRVQAVRFERYLLPWERHLYDSWEVFHGLDDELDAEHAPIVLPAGGRRASGGAPSNGRGAAPPGTHPPPSPLPPIVSTLPPIPPAPETG